MYTCPVVYSIDSVPAHLRTLYLLNPIAAVIAGFRAVILGPAPPDLRSIGIAALESVVALFLAHRFFKALEPSFADVV